MTSGTHVTDRFSKFDKIRVDTSGNFNVETAGNENFGDTSQLSNANDNTVVLSMMQTRETRQTTEKTQTDFMKTNTEQM